MQAEELAEAVLPLLLVLTGLGVGEEHAVRPNLFMKHPGKSAASMRGSGQQFVGGHCLQVSSQFALVTWNSQQCCLGTVRPPATNRAIFLLVARMTRVKINIHVVVPAPALTNG